MKEVDPVHACMDRGKYLVYRSWRIITWKHLSFFFFDSQNWQGLGTGGRFGLCLFFSVLWPVAHWQVSLSSGASGVITDLTTASEIWWVHLTVPILRVFIWDLVPQPLVQPWFLCQSSVVSGTAPSNTAISWQIPTFLVPFSSPALEEVGCTHSCLGRWILTLLNSDFLGSDLPQLFLRN